MITAQTAYTAYTETNGRPQSVRLNKDYYFFAHGLYPRGVGTWIFAEVLHPLEQSEPKFVFKFTGKFINAWRAAIEAAQNAHVEILYVLP